MITKVHELHCGSFCPYHSNVYFPTQCMTCRCLLIESSAGLILCDTGLPKWERLSTPSQLKLKAMQAKYEPGIYCIDQIERLGYNIKDVRHILLTHLDIDHAGAIADFPWAEIHLHEAESVYFHDIPLRYKFRYTRDILPKNLKLKTYSTFGESWKGFESVQAIEGLSDEILYVPLLGHTIGHSGIAIQSKETQKWLLHCGDAFYFKEDLNVELYRKNLASETLQTTAAFDNLLRIRTNNRISLLQANNDQIQITNSHDPRLTAAFI